MKPVKEGDTIRIQVVDLTSKIQGRNNVQVTQSLIKLGRETYTLPLNGQPNIRGRPAIATCLHCGAQIRGNKHGWHVKEAIKQWNTLLEKYLNGEINLEQLKQAPARLTILVKVKIKNKQLKFELATQQDTQKLWKALQKLYPEDDQYLLEKRNT